MDDPNQQILKFQHELTNLYLRWTCESDLGPLDMAEASAEVINKMCSDTVIEFEPDQDFIDKIIEDEE